MRETINHFGPHECPAEGAPLPPEVCATLNALGGATPRTVTPKRRPRARRVTDVAVGAKLPSADYARLMARLAATGETPTAFLRRVIFQELNARSVHDHA